MAWLAIDIGAKRSGLAISWSGQLASPYQLVQGKPLVQLRAIADIVAKEQIHIVVVGTPRPNQKRLVSFHQTLRRLLKDRELAATIVTVDETLTTKEAERLLAQEGARTISSDVAAAVLILDQYFKEYEAPHAI